MPDFLLELFSEEIPARMQPAAAKQLNEKFAALLAEAGLTATTIETHATPRRLALLARGLPAASAATSEERRGPRADAPAQAVDGFLKSTGLSRDQLEERDDPKGRFLYAVIRRVGEPTAAILAARLPALIAGFQWPKSQRWGKASISTASPRWVRPLRGIVALLDDQIVPFEALGLDSGRTTFGHRFLSDGAPIHIADAGSYAAQLADAHVILSAEERRAKIAESAAAAAAKAGVKLRPDAGLEQENAGLTEWPVPLAGHFDEAYLAVPPEIIQLTMRTNQKYFACEDAAGGLAPWFVCVANLEAPDGGRTIVAGNERVLSARLADARFFWEQDLKVPLETQAGKLAGIVFHEKLGTMAEKVARVAKLARWLATSGVVPAPESLTATQFIERSERAARLMKADLVTGTVGEFPELQGVIGGHLAAAQGEAPGVVAAIAQQYLPEPQGCIPVVAALADRLDTLFSFFSIGEAPTGSRDPFALRRAALGIIALSAPYRLDIHQAFTAWLDEEPTQRLEITPGELASRRVEDQVLEFLVGRLEVQQREAGIRHDRIRASTRWNDADDGRLDRIVARARSLHALLDTDEGANLLAGYRRAANILKIEEAKEGQPFYPYVQPELLAEPAEIELDHALDAAATVVSDAVAAEDFAAAMSALAALRPAVDRFFDVVTVNADDQKLRANRLALLAKLRRTAQSVADFALIEG